MFVKVKIALAIDLKGNWEAYGWGKSDGSFAKAAMELAVADVKKEGSKYWVITKIPIPEPNKAKNVLGLPVKEE